MQDAAFIGEGKGSERKEKEKRKRKQQTNVYNSASALHSWNKASLQVRQRANGKGARQDHPRTRATRRDGEGVYVCTPQGICALS